MRKHVVRAVLVALTVVGIAVPAQAALIPIGSLDWTAIDADVNFNVTSGKFSVVNQTGANTTNDFPFTDLLTFDTLNLDVLLGDGTTHDINVKGDLTVNLNSLDTKTYPTAGDTSGLPMSGTLTGTIVLPLGPVTLFSSTHPEWNGSFTITSNQLFGNLIIDVFPSINSFGDSDLIFVEAEPVAAAVPEPATLILVGTGLTGALVRRRRAQVK
jgi:hypothetical protein